MALHHHRVTVRGHFDALDPAVRARLVAEAADHDHLTAAFTKDGTFVYDRALVAFSFRYQLRTEADDRESADAAAAEQATARATAALADGGITYRRLRVTASNLADLWDRSRRPAGPARR